MEIHDAYSKWSATYDLDHNLTRDLDQQVTRATLAGGQYPSIIELGCGTGKNTALLSELSERVCAIDFSPGMLEKARAKVLSQNVGFLAADISRPWPCRAQSAHLVTANLVLEHIRELTPIFSEAYRLLIPGGRFFICELHPFRQYQGKQANFQRGAETIAIPAFVHHLSDFTEAAGYIGFSLLRFQEWWHEADEAKPPRLISLIFEKQG